MVARLALLMVAAPACGYTWVNVTSSAATLPGGAFAGGHATVGGAKNETLTVCRAYNGAEKSGDTSWTPGHLAKYDGSFSESGYWCAMCLTNPSFCYLYDPSFEVLVPDDGETLAWQDSTGTVQDGAVEAGSWATGPVGKYYVCRINDAKNDRLLPGKLFYYDNRYQCCAANPVDNPNEVCTNSWGDLQTYEALIVRK